MNIRSPLMLPYFLRIICSAGDIKRFKQVIIVINTSTPVIYLVQEL